MICSGEKRIMNRRKNDDPKIAYFRVTKRVFFLNNEWYFTSREGEFGPFESESEADRELEMYLSLVEAFQIGQDKDKMRNSNRLTPRIWNRFRYLK